MASLHFKFSFFVCDPCCQHVFLLEQEEYVREELAWTRIEFSDNQLCINLMEGQLGVFDLLDEECRMPKGSDDSWVQKLYDQHLSSKPHPHFSKPRTSNSAFVILHFADTVRYEGQGFLEKNRDTVFDELINVLKASQSELVAELFQLQEVSPLTQGGSRLGRKATREHKLTVGFQFRQSLQMLMDTLNSTTPHYVRCIKPNDLKKPFTFDPKRTVQQLRACGVLETIRISAQGYPSRWTYEEFFSRYRVLLPGPQNLQRAQASCRETLPQLIPDPDEYCFGKTKVFFRAGQVALLERLRAERLRAAAVIIQSRAKGWLQRIRYTRILRAAATIQRYCRGSRARRHARLLRHGKAALVFQKNYRMVVVRQLFLMIRQATVTIQAFSRGTLARRRHRQMVADRRAVLLQARVRGWLARRSFRRVRAAVVYMQCCVRRRAARRELLKLKKEARSVERFRELNKGMEVKVMQLQLRADQQAKENSSLRETLAAYRGAAEAELQALRATVQKLESQKQEKPPPPISDKEVEDRKRAEEKTAQEILCLKHEVEILQREKEQVSSEKEDLSARLLQLQQTQAESVQQAVMKASEALQAELDEEKTKYQGLLRDFTRLEQRYDNLKEMSLLPEPPKGHRRSDSTQSLSLEPPSPSSPLQSPFQPAPPSPEEARRVSVTSPGPERRSLVWSSESPKDQLMEKMDVAKDQVVKMSAEDLEHAYDAVRVANRFLERQLRKQQSQQEEGLEAVRRRLHQAVSGSAQAEDLQDLLEAQEQECVRLRRELKELKSTVSLRRLLTAGELPPVGTRQSLCSEVPRCPKAAAVPGLLECRKRDENKLIRNLITDIRAEGALSLPPGLPASVLFLCVRQADCSGDPARARSFCGAAVTAMKAALKKHQQDVKMTALWLKNACLLHDLLKQHSPKQSSASEKELPLSADLRDLGRGLSDLCIQAFQQLLSITEARLQNIIVPALLESETITGLSGSVVKMGVSRKRAGSGPRPAGSEAPTMASVLRELGVLHAALAQQALPLSLMEQAFQQLTYLICASAINSLLLRKDMCCWSRGIQIRYNVSLLEEWLRSRGVMAGGAVATLEPLIQAAQLLQVGKKTPADAQAIVQTCSALSSQQIVKILMLYTPSSDLDERVTLNFIRTVQALLKSRCDHQPPQLLMDVRKVFPVRFPYLPPPALHAEELVIPDSLKISFLRRA
uniref:Methyl-CpG binding domain protein 3b n=1 Tax=Oryzias latipes TaxID=8090 RepID=A0A3P9K360_ORYLA